ncbi:uncharacterized protein LOC108622149 isoform X2 [Ceratina calcarata]|uniref:Uncharacterized protein LOC108622149 isoform X2 n=1 Tax=Ceratina calcarata TaxID=156304 RepID=A0AAJ7W981_9HYME|nr:uncharacterized protein LOC108622149 isoform X2 [Ceratina calcarata]
MSSENHATTSNRYTLRNLITELLHSLGNKKIIEECILYNCKVQEIMNRLKNEGYKEFFDSEECDNTAKCPQFMDTKCIEIVDLRKRLNKIIAMDTMFCSFELVRSKNTELYQSLFKQLNIHHPLFYAITLHTNDETESYIQYLDMFNEIPKNTLLHLRSNDLTRIDVLAILKKALDHGVRNIFVLRGDSPNTNEEFPHAVDLVRFIRSQFGETFCICVAGYPEMHPESSSKEMDLFYLKEKVDAGADFIITQFFFEAHVFINFVNDCRKIGISVLIIPGIFPIFSYSCLEKLTQHCNVKVPQIILNALHSIEDNEDQVRDYGLELSIGIIKTIVASRTTRGFHFFTLNKHR